MSGVNQSGDLNIRRFKPTEYVRSFETNYDLEYSGRLGEVVISETHDGETPLLYSITHDYFSGAIVARGDRVKELISERGLELCQGQVKGPIKLSDLIRRH